ncbi:hypothetical protein [Oceanidesulfovibrio marinus]|uniref:Uncharacterized protein n=1 Tax=Oceanidesulfovibrio marinus TaxID=370038 RepID=A0A6P1ZMC2_9BACT|nr:hypothetical protein [Oceanidesulfovibrio marinus]TVM35208.1 hypothetical protein DQK91_07390 [Oceanidesulfovibrio marinus]
MKLRIFVCCLLLLFATGVSGHYQSARAAGATERVAKQGALDVKEGYRESVRELKADSHQGVKE